MSQVAQDAPAGREFTERVDRQAAIALLEGAIAAESVTGNELNFVEYLEPVMRRLDLEPRRADFAEGRPNLWGGRAGVAGAGQLLFMGHTDTVHARGWRERWAGTDRENPFGATEIDNEIWGRGSADLKAGICASLAALELLDREGIRLRGGIQFAFVGDEESGKPGTGVSAGARDYVARVLDGAIPRPDFGIYVEPTQLSVYPAQMGFFIADVTVVGRSAYFGVPEKGVDALKATHAALDRLWRHSEEIAVRDTHPLVGCAFLLVTAISGGGYIAVPGECGFSLIRKVLPGEDLDAAIAEFEEALGEGGEGIRITTRYPAGRDHARGGSPVEISADHAGVRELLDAMAGVSPRPVTLAGAPYWSETPFLTNSLDCPAVYCGPGDITCCHTLEERVGIDEYLAAIGGYAAFIARYCGVNRD